MFARSSNPIFGQIAPDPTVPGVTPEMMMAAQQTPPPNMGAAAQMPNPLLPPQQRGQFVNVPAPHSGGMFGGAKVSIDLSRAIAGFLAGMGNPAGFQSLKSLDEQRQEQMALEQQRQQRQQDLQDQMSLIDYRQQHAGPDDFTQRVQALNALKPGLGDTYAQNYAQNGGGMGPVLINPMTGQTMVPAAKAPAMSPPDEAVARLKANPAEAAQFDEVFGPGAAAKILGGPTPSASGGFPHQ